MYDAGARQVDEPAVAVAGTVVPVVEQAMHGVVYRLVNGVLDGVLDGMGAGGQRHQNPPHAPSDRSVGTFNGGDDKPLAAAPTGGRSCEWNASRRP